VEGPIEDVTDVLKVFADEGAMAKQIGAIVAPDDAPPVRPAT
jgi:hypothetical protein